MTKTKRIEGSTHSEYCWRAASHHACACAKIEEQQAEIKRLKDLYEPTYTDEFCQHGLNTGLRCPSCDGASIPA